jgi:hypothetical protein
MIWERQNSIYGWVIVLCIVFGGGYGYGFLSSSWDLPPGSWIRHLYAAWYWDDLGEYAPFGEYVGWRDTSDRASVDCDGFDAVILTFGQSHAANSTHAKYEPRPGVNNFNLHDGKCYRAKDPMLGPNGQGGSIWSRLGDFLIEGGHYERILFVPIALGSTSVSSWVPEGEYYRRLTGARDLLKRQGLEFSYALWVQGSADKTMDVEKYQAEFRKISEVISVPIYVAISTLCGNAGLPAIRRAQQIIGTWEGINPGPDLDQIVTVAERPDGCHFSKSGADRAARLWYQAIVQSR